LKGYRFGYVDLSGKIAVDFQFEDAHRFSEGLAAVRLQGHYGYIDKSGNLIIPPQYDQAFPFSEGRAKIIIKGRCGFIDRTGKLITEPRFYRAGQFSEGLAYVADKTKFGYIDQSGKIIIELKFDDAKSFHEGIAPIKTGKKWKFIRKNGSFLSNEEFDEARTFSEGLAVVGVIRTNFYDRRFGGYSGTRTAYGFVDSSGKFVIQPKFLSAESFSDGLSRVSIPAGDWFGEIEDYIFIDKHEKKMSPRLEYALPFQEGLALVKNKRSVLGFINTEGRFVIKFDVKGNPYPEHMAPVKRARYGFIDADGEVVIAPRFFSARPFADSLAYVDEGERGFIDRNGKRVITLPGNMIPYDFSEGLAAVDVYDSKNQRSLFGYIDKGGDFVIDPQYLKARKLVNGFAAVKFNNDFGRSWGYIDRTGRIVIPAQFHSAGLFHNNVAFVEDVESRRPGLGGEIHYRFIDKNGGTKIDIDDSVFNIYSPQGLPRLNIDNIWTESREDDEFYYSFREKFIPARDKNRPHKVGFVDVSGKFVIAPEFDAVKPFSEGLAPVKLKGLWGCIDESGKLVIGTQFDDMELFSDRRALVEINGKLGYIDSFGTVVIEPQLFDKAFSFREGLALVQLNGRYGFINLAGDFVVAPQYVSARSFSEGLALIGVSNSSRAP
jgi:hypothetical protein